MAIVSRWAERARRSARRSSPDVLELRIHGVNNTPAAEMLDLPLEQIEQVAGDELGGFWAPTPDAAAAGARLPPEHRHHIPRGVRREAYSWGRLARTAPGAAGQALGMAVAGAARLGWALLIPFGLANVAYWSRAIPRPEENRRGWRDANAAAELRVFALALTLLFVTSVSAVSLDLLAIRCFPGPPGGVVARCDQLPAVLDGLTAWTRGERLAIASLVPVVALIALFGLSRSARVRFDEAVSRPAAARAVGAAPGDGAARPSAPRRPVLATTGFWHQRLLPIATARLHLAAGLCLVALCLAWDRVYASRAGCADPRTFFGTTCQGGLGAGWTRDDLVVAGLGAGAAVVLFLVVCRVCVGAEACADVSPRPRLAPRQIWSGWLLLAATGVLGGTAVLVWAPWTRSSRPLEPATVRATLEGLVAPGAGRPVLGASSEAMLGLVAAPSVLVAFLLGLALAGLGWRRAVGARWWLTLFVLGAGCLLLATLWPAPDVAEGWVQTVGARRGWAAGGAALALALQLLAVWRGGRRRPATGGRRAPDAYRAEAWAGAGPGVFMLLAAGAAMTLSGLLVTGTAAWLNVSSGAVSVVIPPDPAAGLPCVQTCTLPMRPLAVPAAYREFGAATLGVLLVLVIALGLLAVARGRLTYIAPAPLSTPAPEPGTDDPRARLDPPPEVDARALTLRALRVLRGRRAAATTHLVEPLVGLLAALVAAALLATLVLSVGPEGPPGAALAAADAAASDRRAFWGWLATAGTWALGAAALAILAGTVAGVLTRAGRPLGLLWDLMCFLPRAAHPFGPPSYAERVVPELRGRVDDWLAGSSTRRVVLSAHSLGAVLAVACLLARDEDDPVRPRIGLVTYGAQLRPYFGRFFPELLGPEAIGTAPCTAPRPTSPDPWLREVLDPPDPALPGVGVTTDTVVRRLGGRGGSGPGGRPPAWINLWRRTDFLGFPVASYGENAVDRGAEEVDRTDHLLTLATHGGYPRSIAYHGALAQVVRRMSESPHASHPRRGPAPAAAR